jgi:hypothetical protein
MCFYARTDYACGDWKWGNMKERCPREHRIGETCGAKLSHIDSNIESPQICKICTEIMAKQRRLAKARTDLARYTTERKLPALAAAKQQEIRDIEQAIMNLNNQRISSKHLHSARYDNQATAQRHQPVPSIAGIFYPLVRREDARHAPLTYNHKSDSSRFPLSI